MVSDTDSPAGEAANNGSPLVLVYQPGKTGSVMLSERLKQALPAAEIRHIHTIANLQSLQAIIDRAGRADDLTAGMAHQLEEVLQWGRSTGEEIARRRRHGEPIRVVTAVREPVDYAVSAFFQNLPRLMPASGPLQQASSGFAEELARYFCDLLQRWRHGERVRWTGEAFVYRIWDVAYRWFELELEPVAGIGVEELSSAQDHGYAIVERDPFAVLFYRYEDIAQALPASVPGFFGLDSFALASENLGVEKETGELYRAFREIVRLPEDAIAHLYAGRQATALYAAEERSRFLRRWVADG